ncbi:hypothetical protein QE400_003428 [Xanthomonas sacchari]|uniref:hypothetical protein n=1 Tax=Xanthomonas sacchari TaxID=56458 RepID=UPI0027839D0A|nr:hypothetical protein [Xanthomonas sacchari]MDQ1094015.1 hypothetical protein [Xanthomonas sacchari]
MVVDGDATPRAATRARISVGDATPMPWTAFARRSRVPRRIRGVMLRVGSLALAAGGVLAHDVAPALASMPLCLLALLAPIAVHAGGPLFAARACVAARWPLGAAWSRP